MYCVSSNLQAYSAKFGSHYFNQLDKAAIVSKVFFYTVRMTNKA